VVDISHKNFEDQIEIVKQTLVEIGAISKSTYIVFNKIDLYRHIAKNDNDLTPPTKENLTLEDLRKTWMAKSNEQSIFISALTKENIDELKTLLYNKVKEIHITRYPYDNFLF
jgi:GTP-binding protein HflX